MLNPGIELQNRYLIERRVGEGGMGTVYIATDRRFGTKVAIKETHFSDANMRRAFEHEAQLLNGLRHPTLPRVSDHFCEGDGQFIVMEYIAGKDLSKIAEGEFEVADVMRWADSLLDALDYLHTQKQPILHRDIKPQNLKLTDRGDVILLDFGLAKGSVTEQTQASLAESVFGYSISYSPLEQIQGVGTDPRTDIYSLAATIYHLLTRQTPIDCITRATAIVKGCDDPLLPAHKVNPEVPSSISNAIYRAMSLDPALRPASAAEMRQELRKALSQNTLPEKHSDTVTDEQTIAIAYDSSKVGKSNLPPIKISNPAKTTAVDSRSINRRAAQIGNNAVQTDYTTRIRKPKNSFNSPSAVRRPIPIRAASDKGLLDHLQNSRLLQLGVLLMVLLLGVTAGIFAWHSVNPANDQSKQNPIVSGSNSNSVDSAETTAQNNNPVLAATPVPIKQEALAPFETATIQTQPPQIAALPPQPQTVSPTENAQQVVSASTTPISETKAEEPAQPVTRPNNSNNQVDADESMKAEMKKQINEALRQREEASRQQRGEQPPPYGQPPPPDGRGFSPPYGQPPPPPRRP